VPKEIEILNPEKPVTALVGQETCKTATNVMFILQAA